MFQAYAQACAEGWLPQALQQLGSKVWAAWPQKYACNDDLCLNLDCLIEQTCGRLQCTGCKVSLTLPGVCVPQVHAVFAAGMF
jgi:hypothetical protein